MYRSIIVAIAGLAVFIAPHASAANCPASDLSTLNACISGANGGDTITLGANIDIGAGTIADVNADVTIVNNGFQLRGAGLVKRGGGTLVLGSTNGFTGGSPVAIEGGTLAFSIANALPPQPQVTLRNGGRLLALGTVTIGTGGSLSFDTSGIVSAVGGSSITIAGTLNLANTVQFGEPAPYDGNVVIGANPITYATGTIRVGGGTLSACCGPSLTNSTGQLVSTYIIDGNAAIAFPGVASFNRLEGFGVVSITGVQNLFVNQGDFSGEIPGTISLRKTNSGTLRLGGIGPGYTGATIVTGGRLIVDNDITPSASVTVNAANLNGRGFLPAVTMNVGSVISPADADNASVGRLTTGALTLNSGSTYIATVNGPGAGSQYDTIRTTGPIAINGAALTVITNGPVPAGTDVFIMDTFSALTGEFTGKPNGSTFTSAGSIPTPYVISYISTGGVILTALGIPGPPQNIGGAAGNATFSVTFDPPLDDGGSPVLDYRVDCTIPPSSSVASTQPGSPVTFTGRPNGVVHTCSVRARNANGLGLPSATVVLTPMTVPGAPAVVSATPGDASATVVFNAPASTGGSPILDYTAQCGTQSMTAATSPIVVTGLVNGATVTCVVRARNAVGIGPNTAGAMVTPVGVPAAPTLTGVAPGAGTATVSFNPPASNGGSPILDYTAQCGTQSMTGAGSPLVVTSLVNGASVSCRVRARNAIGTGPDSTTLFATPLGAPAAPTITSVTAGDRRATVAFTPPASDGGSPILDYTAQCGAQSFTGAASPLVVTGLMPGILASCVVRARNATSTGPDSAPQPVTPLMLEFSAPSATGTGTIVATLSGGGLGCTFAPTPSFIAVTGDPASPPAGTAPPGVSFPHGLFDFTTTGCVAGSTITLSITYPEALPVGTQYFKYGPTPADPAPHWYVLPATIAGNTATFNITDGGLGDDDLAANGTVVDQGGPGGPVGGPGGLRQVPTLSTWTLVLLALLTLVVARRRIYALRT